MTSEVLLIFARAPVAGRVKTRLAASVGHQGAAAVYRAMGRQVVDAVRRGPWRTVVCFDPPEALAEVQDWLGEEHEYWPQRGQDLGARMDHAVRRALATDGRTCVIGTDAPDVDHTRVREAFDALVDTDVVFGPANDGGYYLVALRAPAPELFQRMQWGTADVLSRSLERARSRELSIALLQPLDDVDRLADLARYPALMRTIDVR